MDVNIAKKTHKVLKLNQSAIDQRNCVNGVKNQCKGIRRMVSGNMRVNRAVIEFDVVSRIELQAEYVMVATWGQSGI